MVYGEESFYIFFTFRSDLFLKWNILYILTFLDLRDNSGYEFFILKHLYAYFSYLEIVEFNIASNWS